MGKTENLFRAVARHRGTNSRDPAEDRLTDVLTAVLNHSPELSRAYLRMLVEEPVALGTRRTEFGWLAEARSNLELWLGDRKDPILRPVNWQSQCFTRIVSASGKRGFIDLLGASDEMICVIENKLWTGIGDRGDGRTQLDTYCEFVGLQPGNSAVVAVVAPETNVPSPHDVLDGVGIHSWTQVTRAFEDEELDLDPVEEFLRDEFVDYLRREGIVNDRAVSPGAARRLGEWAQDVDDVIELFGKVQRRLSKLAEGIGAELKNWHPRQGPFPNFGRGPDNGPGYALQYFTFRDVPREWKLFASADLEFETLAGVQGGSGIYLMAGIDELEGDQILALDLREKLAGYREFEEDNVRRIMKIWPLEHFLEAGDSQDSQVRAVSDQLFEAMFPDEGIAGSGLQQAAAGE